MAEARPTLHDLDLNASRNLQQVTTLTIRKTVIKWMIENVALHGIAGLSRRTIGAFPEHFRSQKTTNTIKAARWWRQHNQYLKEPENDVRQISCSKSRVGKRKKLSVKGKPGRGHKRSEWVQWLYPRLLEAFERFKKSGVKFSSKLLCELALSVLLGPDSIFTAQSTDPKDNQFLVGKINHTWIQQFMNIHNLVLLSQRGRLTCSPQKELQIEMHTTYHLGVLHRGFLSRDFDENLMEKLDETHFVVNLDNGRTLGFKGDTTVKYVEVVSGGDSMTMVVRISGGWRSMIEAPMLIFTNENRNYPIRGLEDNIVGVSYRSGRKGWMDQSIFPEYFLELRAFQPDLHGRVKNIWLDKCTGHNVTARLAAILASKNVVLRYLPPCSTHLCQLADTFIISKIKDAWTRRWEAKKTELIGSNAWQNRARGDGQWSGKLTNSGKRFFLELASDSVEDVNREVDCNNMSYTRKSMIRCGMALDVDGSWNGTQLFPHLQELVAKHREYFEGQEVHLFVVA